MPAAGSRTVSPSRGFDHGDDELHDGPRRVELAGIARRVPHLAEHGLVKQAEGVDLVLGSEVDFVDLVDDIAQQVAVRHAVDRALEDRGDHVAAVAVGAVEASAGRRTGPRRACRPGAWPRPG